MVELKLSGICKFGLQRFRLKSAGTQHLLSGYGFWAEGSANQDCGFSDFRSGFVDESFTDTHGCGVLAHELNFKGTCAKTL